MKIIRGVTLFKVKTLIDFQIYYPCENKIANTKITKIYSLTKIRVSNVNIGSEISHYANQRNL